MGPTGHCRLPMAINDQMTVSCMRVEATSEAIGSKVDESDSCIIMGLPVVAGSARGHHDSPLHTEVVRRISVNRLVYDEGVRQMMHESHLSARQHAHQIRFRIPCSTGENIGLP